ncbi:fibronectin type III domain-containing protein [Paenibacillus sp. RRE4]|uniref:RCC1 domain-containing protein n=1 Tax=Paenibacillus sp. RRE4 TaxID=2962587 RepID=UPI00288245F2|nr:fibronectin type III domain-containing protein [Paenibacillus sp. RRE4]MDT0123942.1 fibronectin type III domain-containing protein [Paenibacillus sp. RRE4]
MKIKVAVKLLISLSLLSTLGVTSLVQAESKKVEKPVNQIAIGQRHFLVLGRDGTIWSAGENSGQLGRESDAEFDDLKAIPSATDMVGISAGTNSSYGITKQGKVLSWQKTNSGLESGFSSLNNVKTVAEGKNFYAVLTEEGTVWTWGINSVGQLGLGERLKKRDIPTLVPNLEKVTEIAAGYMTTYALQEDGTLWGWGALQNGNTNLSFDPVQIEFPTKIKHVYSTFFRNYNSSFINTIAVIDVNNNVWMWGDNFFGQLGDGTHENRIVPKIIAGLGPVKQMALGKTHVLALKMDGTVWAWGRNIYGQLGDGTKEERLFPTQVPGLLDIDSVAAGDGNISGAVSKTSQIYIWGQDLRYPSEYNDGKALTSPQLITINDQPKEEIMMLDKPENLKLKVVNSSSVQLSWDQPKAQNELEDGYNIYQNNVIIGSTKEKNFIINNLDATKEYNFYIKAKATSGQESEASNTVKKRGIGKYTYVYNSSGQLTSIIYESGKRISYEYDKNGNLKKTTVVNP